MREREEQINFSGLLLYFLLWIKGQLSATELLMEILFLDFSGDCSHGFQNHTVPHDVSSYYYNWGKLHHFLGKNVTDLDGVLNYGT